MKHLCLTLTLSFLASAASALRFSDLTESDRARFCAYIASQTKESRLILVSFRSLEGTRKDRLLNGFQCAIIGFEVARWRCMLHAEADRWLSIPVGGDIYVSLPPRPNSCYHPGRNTPDGHPTGVFLETTGAYYVGDVWNQRDCLAVLMVSPIDSIDWQKASKNAEKLGYPPNLPTDEQLFLSLFGDDGRARLANAESNRLFRLNQGCAFRLEGTYDQTENRICWNSSTDLDPVNSLNPLSDTITLSRQELSEFVYLHQKTNASLPSESYQKLVNSNPEALVPIQTVNTLFGLGLKMALAQQSSTDPCNDLKYVKHTPLLTQSSRFKGFKTAIEALTDFNPENQLLAIDAASNILASSQLHGTPGETLSFCRKISECILQIPSQSTYQPGAGVEEAKCDLLLQCLAACRSRDRLRTAPLCKAVWLFSRREKAFLEGRPSWNGRTPAGGPENGTARLPTNEDRDRVMKKLQRLDFELSEFAKQVRENDVNDSKEETP